VGLQDRTLSTLCIFDSADRAARGMPDGACRDRPPEPDDADEAVDWRDIGQAHPVLARLWLASADGRGWVCRRDAGAAAVRVECRMGIALSDGPGQSVRETAARSVVDFCRIVRELMPFPSWVERVGVDPFLLVFAVEVRDTGELGKFFGLPPGRMAELLVRYALDASAWVDVAREYEVLETRVSPVTDAA